MNKKSVHHQKRHGRHQRHTKKFVKVYLPYLPLLTIVVIGLAISTFWQPINRSGVLAYATNTTSSGLLQSTNEQRQKNGKVALALNSKLNQAAQAKANDMAERDYWSHNTPEGQEPWIFIDQAGYAYKQAGENLAYGFDNSSDTVTGWMNSPSHKANMLDSAYKDVGFGYANSSNYQGSGPQTVVVAMYGNPQVAAATAPVAPAPKVPQTVKPKPVASAPAKVPEKKAEAAPKPPKEEPKPITSTEPLPQEPEPVAVSRIQMLTAGNAAWSTFAVGLLSGASIGYLVLKHGLALRRMFVRGERFILHHALFDVTIVAFVVLCGIVTRSAGIIL
jgi:uncharacterized protein YkwD